MRPKCSLNIAKSNESSQKPTDSFKFEMKVYDLCCQKWHSNVESVGFWLDSLQFAIFYENFGRINWYYNAKTPSWTFLLCYLQLKWINIIELFYNWYYRLFIKFNWPRAFTQGTIYPHLITRTAKLL